MTKQERYFKTEVEPKSTQFGPLQPRIEAYSIKYVRLLKDHNFNLRGVNFKVKAGFCWDGASIPRVAIATGQKLEPVMHLPSLAHDYLYRFGLTDRKTADKIFYDLCLQNGMSKFRAGKMYVALRMFGGPTFRKYRKKGYHK